ncbi:MAG TPA: hypothetical protein VMT75_07820 [Candidatus Saccharimonadales bacterium]|nr:hypothetical protein [Candidatus Saccharimonadales bacterium]
MRHLTNLEHLLLGLLHQKPASGYALRKSFATTPLAHWYLVGLFGLIQVTWMLPVLRIGHSFEIGADSFVYAAVLVHLFVPRHRESTVSTPAHAAPMFPS